MNSRLQFPGFASFHWLHDTLASRPYRGHIFVDAAGNSQSREALAAVARGIKRPDAPLVVEWEMGERSPSDVIWESVTSLIVAMRFVGALDGFSGWATYPVEVHDKFGELVPGYAGLAITGHCGPAYPNMEVVEGEGIHANYVGVVFDPASWDGSDLFYPERGWGPIATDAVRSALRAARIRNVLIEPLSEIRRNKQSCDRMRLRKLGPWSEGES